MKRLFYLVNITICAALASLTACNLATSGQSNGDVVSFDVIKVDTVCPLFKNIDKPACHLTMEMEVPVSETSEVVSKNLQKSIIALSMNEDLQSKSNSDMHKMTQVFVHDYLINYLSEGKSALEDYDEDLRSAEEWMSYEERVFGKAIYNSNGLISYQVNVYSYTGGAHGNSSLRNMVFDGVQCYQLHLGDVLIDSATDDVAAMMTKNLSEQFEGKSIEELCSDGTLFQQFSMSPTENFYVDDKGMTWTFDPYEIAPYATGIITISLTWEQLYPYVVSDSPVMRIAKTE